MLIAEYMVYNSIMFNKMKVMYMEFAVATSISGKEIKNLRGRLELTQEKFGRLVNASKPTVERWERSESVTGPIVTLVKVLSERPEIKEELTIPNKTGTIRLWYMYHSEVCAIIDVNERMQKVKVQNFTCDLLKRPFGKISVPTYEQYEEFLESRCFPKTRDKMKIMLDELNIPFYDPILIIEKTQGRMAEDNFWIKID